MPSPQPSEPTVMLRLFHQAEPFRQIEARPLGLGELTVGRDHESDWTLPDPDREISRRHCVIALHGGRVTVRDISANGVLVGPSRSRAPAGEALPLAPGEILRMGQYMIVVDAAAPPAEDFGFDAPFTRPMLKAVQISAAAVQTPCDWAPSGPATDPGDAPAQSEGALLEAFCVGARLDVSAFAGEDPAQIMRRLGDVYRQMVLGLGDLMNERTSVKTEYRMTRTTVRSEGNNPFRWAPAQRVAVDLLRPRDDGFLSGPAAVKASFGDMKKHLLCMLAGTRAAVSATLDTLAPEAVEEGLKGRSMVFRNRGAAAWSHYGRVHAALRQTAHDDADSSLNAAFRQAYEHQLQALDSVGTQP